MHQWAKIGSRDSRQNLARFTSPFFLDTDLGLNIQKVILAYPRLQIYEEQQNIPYQIFLEQK